MTIPGLRPSFDVRGKVRIGEKREVEKQGRVREFPAALDYFICEDGEFAARLGQPKTLKIQLPFATLEENFPSGLEQWAGQMLVCYAKGEIREGQPVAWRKKTMRKAGREVNLLDGFTQTAPEMGSDRVGVACPVRACAFIKSKECKPMGRLQFYIEGFPREAGIFQLDTKSWNSVENIEGFLTAFGDPRGRTITLGVRIEQQGRDKFPVLYMEGPPVQPNTPAEMELADALLELRKCFDVETTTDEALKVRIALVLDLSNPGWREAPEFIEAMKARFAEITVRGAASSLLAKYEL